MHAQKIYWKHNMTTQAQQATTDGHTDLNVTFFNKVNWKMLSGLTAVATHLAITVDSLSCTRYYCINFDNLFLVISPLLFLLSSCTACCHTGTWPEMWTFRIYKNSPSLQSWQLCWWLLDLLIPYEALPRLESLDSGSYTLTHILYT